MPDPIHIHGMPPPSRDKNDDRLRQGVAVALVTEPIDQSQRSSRVRGMTEDRTRSAN